jgi:alpha-galactosidase/6-phospho-beta-glucosidase family protein
MKTIAYITYVCMIVLGVCALYLQFANPAMTRTQLLLTFWREYAIIIFGIIWAWWGLDRHLK